MIPAIIIFAAILLLIILLSPVVTRLYRIYYLGKEQIRKEENGNEVKDVHPEASIVGKSKFDLSQPLPTTATPMAKRPEVEAPVSNFVPEENQEPMAIDVPLEKEIVEKSQQINEEEEAMELEELFGKDVHLASGVDVNDLGKLKHVIETPSAGIREKQQAGRILYENRETEIVAQMADNEKTSSIISGLIDLHMTSYLSEKENTNSQVKVSDELNDFDVSQFLRTK